MDKRRLVTALTRAIKYEVEIERRRTKVLSLIDRLAATTREPLEKVLNNILQHCKTAMNATDIAPRLSIKSKSFPFGQAIQMDITNQIKSELLTINLDGTPGITIDGRKIAITLPVAPMAAIVIDILASDWPSETIDQYFLRQLADQLNVLVLTSKYRDAAEIERAAVQKLLRPKLTEYETWQEVLDILTSYIPSWCAGYGESPVVQLLIVRSADQTLQLVAGTGANTSSTFVLITDSVSGKAVTEKWQEPRVIRTIDFEGDYISYRLNSAEFELVAPILYDEDTLAILNFETDKPDVYNPLFISFCAEACSFIAPILGALIARLAEFRTTESRIYYVVSDVLTRISSTFGHLIAQPLLSANFSIGDLKYYAENPPIDNSVVAEEVSRLQAIIRGIEADCDEFISEFPDLLSIGPQKMKTLLERRLKALKNRAKIEKIAFTTVFPTSPIEAYGSSILIEHVFNICYNSFQQIKELQREKPDFKGKISIRCSKKSSITASGKDVQVNFVELMITDNGGGIPPDRLPLILKGKSFKLGGNGYAIPAAVEYFSSVGGSMTLCNHRSGLRTIIRMQEYDEKRHVSKLIQV